MHSINMAAFKQFCTGCEGKKRAQASDEPRHNAFERYMRMSCRLEPGSSAWAQAKHCVVSAGMMPTMSEIENKNDRR